MKKVIISLFISVLFIFGINDVKAAEGKDQIGSKTQFCEYCASGNDCIYVTLDMEKKRQANEKTFYNFRVFNRNMDNEQKFDTSACINTKLTCYVAVLDNFPAVGSGFTGCDPYLYYVHFNRENITIQNPNEDNYYYYYFTDKADNSQWVNDATNKLVTVLTEVSVMTNKKYTLKTSYGIDDTYINSPKLKDKINETLSKVKEQQGGTDINTNDGCAVLTEPIKEKMNWILNLIKYGGSILAILLGAFDFMRAVLSDEDNATKKAAGNFVKRLIAAILIFLLPLLLQFILTTVEIEGFNVDAPTCGVGISE